MTHNWVLFWFYSNKLVLLFCVLSRTNFYMFCIYSCNILFLPPYSCIIMIICDENASIILMTFRWFSFLSMTLVVILRMYSYYAPAYQRSKFKSYYAPACFFFKQFNTRKPAGKSYFLIINFVSNQFILIRSDRPWKN